MLGKLYVRETICKANDMGIFVEKSFSVIIKKI